MAEDQQPFFGEQVEGQAHGEAGDTEGSAKIPFAGQAFVGAQSALENIASQLGGRRRRKDRPPRPAAVNDLSLKSLDYSVRQ